MSDIVEKGAMRIEWARAHMPVLAKVREELVQGGSLRGKRIAMALHVEAKTGMLALTLKDAGASVRLAGCNPLSTDDSVASALGERYGLETFARKGQTNEEYYENLHKILDIKPDIIIDDGMDAISLLHTDRTELLDGILGANEETTTGVVRLRSMASEGALRFPVMDVNDASMKYLFDNRYGTGQSTMDGILNATNIQLSGKFFVVAGYGWCGRGIAMRAKGMGARVAVTEIDPVKAVEARMDGFDVMTMAEAAPLADFIVTATGCKDVVSKAHFPLLKDGCILANSGHFDNEVDKLYMAQMADVRPVRELVEEYLFKDGRRAYLLAQGRLVNLAAGQGHPVEIMDLSFSLQALCAAYLAENHATLKPGVYKVPLEIDRRVAWLELEAMGISIDSLSAEQQEYLSSWKHGT